MTRGFEARNTWRQMKVCRRKGVTRIGTAGASRDRRAERTAFPAAFCDWAELVHARLDAGGLNGGSVLEGRRPRPSRRQRVCHRMPLPLTSAARTRCLSTHPAPQ